jgi:hypothetical protein
MIKKSIAYLFIAYAITIRISKFINFPFFRGFCIFCQNQRYVFLSYPFWLTFGHILKKFGLTRTKVIKPFLV